MNEITKKQKNIFLFIDIFCVRKIALLQALQFADLLTFRTKMLTEKRNCALDLQKTLFVCNKMEIAAFPNVAACQTLFRFTFVVAKFEFSQLSFHDFHFMHTVYYA